MNKIFSIERLKKIQSDNVCVKILSSYLGYTSYVKALDEYVNNYARIRNFSEHSIELILSTHTHNSRFWWYPPYSLEIEDDVKPITPDGVKKMHYGFIGKELHTFMKSQYDKYLSQFNGLDKLKYMNNRLIKIGDKIKLLDSIVVRKDVNDILVLGQHTKTFEYVLLPITSVFPYSSIDFYKPKDLVYDSKWEN